MGAFLIVLGIMAVAGGIAYVGDRVGHQVGRKRLTLFGLRPRYTSTIVAVGTGMLIALAVTLGAIAASGLVRTAFFRLGQLNAQINELQARAAAQQQELATTRNGDLVLPLGAPVVTFFQLIDTASPIEAQVTRMSSYFDQVVKSANARLTKPPYLLKPYAKTSSDRTVRELLRRDLETTRDADAAVTNGRPGIVLMLPVASQNLFRGETLSFGFNHYADIRDASAGEELGSVEVSGGTALDPIAIYGALYQQAARTLARRGFPAPFITAPTSGIDRASLLRSIAEVGRLHGRYRVVARAATEIYPHDGVVALVAAVVPARGK